MKKLYLILSVALCVVVACTGKKAPELKVNQSFNYAFEDENTKLRVDSLYNRMSLDERVMQLCGMRPDMLLDAQRKLSLDSCRKKIPNGIGHFSQFSFTLNFTPEELREFVQTVQHFLCTETPCGIPAIFHEEAITGFTSLGATVFPQHVGAACSWNPDLIEEKTAATAMTMRMVGSTQALSPMIDVCKTAYFERMEEGFGEDGYLTARMGLSFVRGLQRGGLNKGVAATAKHYAGYAGIYDEKEFMEETLLPFEVAFRLGGVKNVMPGYHKYQDTNCIGSKTLLTHILRNQLDFDGVVVSDYGAIFALGNKGDTVAAWTMNAGADVELPNPDFFPYLKSALEKGMVSEERFEQAVKRTLTMKLRMGLLDKRETWMPDAKHPLEFDPPAHRQMAYELAAQSIVLLKNDNILPLNGGIKKIALVGPNADAYQSLLGDYTYHSMVAYFCGKPVAYEQPPLYTLFRGLQDRLPHEITLQHERGCVWDPSSEAIVNRLGTDPTLKTMGAKNPYGLPVPDEARALKIVGESDVVIAAMGENLFLTGEGRNRESIRLPQEQELFLHKILQTGKPVILIIFGGRPLYITEFESRCAAILQAWYPGEEGGHALADILLGKINPSGKLCMTYPKTESREPQCYNYGYHTATQAPLYPFGHGLSYTSFDYKNLEAQNGKTDPDSWVPVLFTVANSGSRAGAEVVQLYVAPKNPRVKSKPMQLKGFVRLPLEAGESKNVKLWLSPQQLAFYENGQWKIEPGEYELLLASSSTDIRQKQTITLAGSSITLKHRNIFFAEVE
ncbi:MAG: glycoside hydrolase family 3 C-terminal domain-containing protein [Bacteroidales bacterium]|nr:glycoside hydrolase family 3 C-terminal domain-containing protein [Bacteroidales bacterium]